MVNEAERYDPITCHVNWKCVRGRKAGMLRWSCDRERISNCFVGTIQNWQFKQIKLSPACLVAIVAVSKKLANVPVLCCCGLLLWWNAVIFCGQTNSCQFLSIKADLFILNSKNLSISGCSPSELLYSNSIRFQDLMSYIEFGWEDSFCSKSKIVS